MLLRRRRPDLAWHLLTAAVAGFAVLFQLWLVVDGAATLLPESQPPLATRLVRFVSYFTFLCNILVCVSTLALVRGGTRGRWRKVVRLDAVTGIAVTGLVHWFLLRPLLDLHGASYVADKLLHVVVPLLVVLGWCWFGPRRWVGRAEVLPSLVFPVVWLAYTLVHGAVTGWYPYPFLDVGEHGYAAVGVGCAAVAVLFLALAVGAVMLDRRLPVRSPVR
jgi:hypothetical protein